MKKDDYISPYEKRDYSGVISVRDPESGEMRRVTTNRTIYRNTEINPDLIIPKGTKIGKEVIHEDTSNLERMASGKSPIITRENQDGTVTYERVELHHLTGEETQPGSKFFTGESRDGSLVELRSSVHDTTVIHNLNEPETSFRRDRHESVDLNGKTIRTNKKSLASIHYDKTRSQYWKDRANEIKQERSDLIGKDDKEMSWLDKFKSKETEKPVEESRSISEQRQSWIESIKVDLTNSGTQIESNNNVTSSGSNNNSSFPDPMEKGDALDAPGHSVYEDNDDNNGTGFENDGIDMDDGMEL